MSKLHSHASEINAPSAQVRTAQVWDIPDRGDGGVCDHNLRARVPHRTPPGAPRRARGRHPRSRAPRGVLLSNVNKFEILELFTHCFDHLPSDVALVGLLEKFFNAPAAASFVDLLKMKACTKISVQPSLPTNLAASDVPVSIAAAVL